MVGVGDGKAQSKTEMGGGGPSESGRIGLGRKEVRGNATEWRGLTVPGSKKKFVEKGMEAAQHPKKKGRLNTSVTVCRGGGVRHGKLTELSVPIIKGQRLFGGGKKRLVTKKSDERKFHKRER